MITLIIKKPGHTIAIPGLPIVRSPAEVDISKLDIRVVAMYLQTDGIDKYTIIAKRDDQTEVYTQKDFDAKGQPIPKKKKKGPNLDKRMNKIENMLQALLSRGMGKDTENREQIINKLDELEKKITSSQSTTIIKEISLENPTVEDDDDFGTIDAFIPEIDVSDMTIRSSENVKTIKQDANIKESADLLAELTKKK